MEITYYGHSAFLIEVEGKKILFDPFITPNELAKEIDTDEIKPDFVLLSHGHADHVADVEKICKQSNATLVANFEVVGWFQNKGIEKVHPMNHGGKWKFDFGTVKLVNAVHSSSMPDGSYGGNPGGFVIQTPQNSFYYAGDTALHQDMKQIGESYQIDFAFMPIGDNFTMDIEDAVKAARYVNTSKIVAMHYDTFPYIKIEQEEVKKIADEAGVELILFNIGEKKDI